MQVDQRAEGKQQQHQTIIIIKVLEGTHEVSLLSYDLGAGKAKA